MRKFGLSFLLILLFLISAGNALAHVQLDYPLGSETFETDKKVQISWTLLIQHDQQNWDLYFSSNGGSNWEAIQLDIETSQLSYLWTVPQTTTENARIRIVQDNTGTNYEDVSGDFTITDTQTSVEIGEKSEYTFKLHANYPNPFNPTTIINYELPATNEVDVSIFNVLGQKMVTLISARQKAGIHSIEWDASHLSAGTYFIKFEAGEFIQIKKAILLK